MPGLPAVSESALPGGLGLGIGSRLNSIRTGKEEEDPAGTRPSAPCRPVMQTHTAVRGVVVRERVRERQRGSASARWRPAQEAESWVHTGGRRSDEVVSVALARRRGYVGRGWAWTTVSSPSNFYHAWTSVEDVNRGADDHPAERCPSNLSDQG